MQSFFSQPKPLNPVPQSICYYPSYILIILIIFWQKVMVSVQSFLQVMANRPIYTNMVNYVSFDYFSIDTVKPV